MAQNYDNRTRRIEAWGSILDALGKNLMRVVWFCVFVIILVALGKYLISTSQIESQLETIKPPTSQAIVPPVEWGEVDRAVLDALKSAKAAATEVAENALSKLYADWVERIDSDFLQWYFSYWNQQKMGLEGVFHSVHHWVDSEAPTAAQAITAEIQEEFATRVLRPQITQLELERITRESVDTYVAHLQKEIQAIPERYDIPTEDWGRYLSDIAVMTGSTEGNRQVDLSLKALTGTTVAGTMVLGTVVVKSIAKIGSKVSAKMAGKAAATMAAETGGKVAAKLGGKLLGPIIGIGIIVWDIWDHNTTKAESMPILRKNLIDYLDQVKESLLDDPETGVMAAIHQIDSNIAQSLAEKKVSK